MKWVKTMSLITQCRNGNYCNVLKLLHNGVSISEKNEKGQTALHICCIIGAENVTKILIDNGADIMAVDNNGNTPLHLCGHSEIITLLVKSGAKVDCRNNMKLTPLDLMIRKGVPEETVALMKNYIAINNGQRRDLEGTLTINGSTIHILKQFCKELGYLRLIILLIGILFISFYVAYTTCTLGMDKWNNVPISIEEANAKENMRVEL